MKHKSSAVRKFAKAHELLKKTNKSSKCKIVI